MIGISYWNEADGTRLAQDLQEAFEQPGGIELFFEQVPLTRRREHYRVEVRPCRDEDVVEIDFFSELKAIDPAYDVL
ncbi:MAG: hypothetical protein IJ088_01840 [Clostridia bacterium]|nr:hypothetical protein [Clostridia bacterium]